MRKGQIKNVSYLKDRRRALRNNPTAAETTLWKLLQNEQLAGRRFRRQYSIANYIVDFYCASEKLVIELDGEVHNDPINRQNDHERDEILRYLGYKILRFENKLVFQNPDGVLDIIKEHFNT